MDYLLSFEYTRHVMTAHTLSGRIESIRDSGEFQQLKQAYLSGDVTDAELCAFVDKLVGERQGCICSGAAAAETIVLVLVERLTKKGAELLAKQARMDLCGIGMLSAIARHCLHSVTPLNPDEIDRLIDASEPIPLLREKQCR